MRRTSSVLVGLVVGVLFFLSQGWAQCPEDPNDNGICDTLYVEKFAEDETLYPPAPWFVRFPIRVTSDVPDPEVDSISGIVIPLCYSWSGAGYCSLTYYHNNTNLYPFPDLEGSVFRHLPSMDDPQERNFMMDFAERMDGTEWDTRIVDLFDQVSTFRLSLVPTGTQDQRFPGGSRVLVAAMTFKVEGGWSCDYLTIDSCFWPPTGRLAFSRSDAANYIPRHFLPTTRGIGIPGGMIDCPFPDTRNSNGNFQSDDKFRALVDDCGVVSWVYANWDPLPPGISDADVVFTTGPDTRYAEGHVVYTVDDHCLGGGWIRLYLTNNVVNGPVDDCVFEIILSEAPPGVVPESLLALAEHTLMLRVYGDREGCDSVTSIEFDEMWFEPDSLQPPASAPSCEPGYPAVFTWSPAVSDTGIWICSFTATDAGSDMGTDQIVILVGTAFCGDCIDDALIDLGDLIYLVHWLYKGGPAPDPLCRADANCDGAGDIGDVVYLINYLFRFGPAPCVDCCTGG
ncbi:MAG: hypothetical protein JSV10_02540 [Candidatus Zixiibacteriota bacterium]|nr:MAG: hypothetical protein JSV10_02540 [candidate division Zixibacteria bacterium]